MPDNAARKRHVDSAVAAARARKASLARTTPDHHITSLEKLGKLSPEQRQRLAVLAVGWPMEVAERILREVDAAPELSGWQRQRLRELLDLSGGGEHDAA